MIFGFDVNEIVKLAIENHSYMADGVVQYDYKDRKIFGAPFTTGTLENPANPFIEIYRLHQGEYTQNVCNCCDCPYVDEELLHKLQEEYTPEEYKELYPGMEECCEDAAFEMLCENFYDDIYEDDIRQQIREVINDQIGEQIYKLEKIYLKISEICDSTQLYQQKVFNNNFIMNIVDKLEDDFYENGFPENFNESYILAGEIDRISTDLQGTLDYVQDGYLNLLEKWGDGQAYEDRVKFIQKNKLHEALYLLQDHKLDECLEILNNSECYCDEQGRGL